MPLLVGKVKQGSESKPHSGLNKSDQVSMNKDDLAFFRFDFANSFVVIRSGGHWESRR